MTTNNQLWSIRWARRTRTCERELSLWRRTRGSGCFKDRLDRVTAEIQRLTRIYRWSAHNPFMINRQAGCSGPQSPISGKLLMVLNNKLCKILGNIDFIIWQRGCKGLGDWDIGHWHGKDQQWRWPGSWSGWRKVGYISCSWRCFQDAFKMLLRMLVNMLLQMLSCRLSMLRDLNNPGQATPTIKDIVLGPNLYHFLPKYIY